MTGPQGQTKDSFMLEKILFMISVHYAQDMLYTPTLLSQIDYSYSSIPLMSNLQD